MKPNRPFLRKRPFRPDIAFFIAPLCVLAVMTVTACFTGYWPLSGNPYNSYTLQACAWLQGRLDLGMDYSWLELAIHEGKYYVSFPPFPSFVMLPLALFFGANASETLVCWIVVMLGVIQAVRIYRSVCGSNLSLYLYVLFLFLSTGFMFIAQTGWVWFMAQSFCFTLCLSAVAASLNGRGGWSLCFWACAVGCRPLVALFFPVLICLLRARTPQRSWGRWLKEHWTWILPPLVIALIYMILNYARFGNPLEFGHNYLPEFQKYGKQFSLSYVSDHLLTLLRFPAFNERGRMVPEYMDTYCFFIMNPLYITFLASLANAVLHRDESAPVRHLRIWIPLLTVAHLLVTCMHRTLGAFQWGNRYLLDALPFLFVGILLFRPRSERFDLFQLPLFILGFSLSLSGTLLAYMTTV